MAYKMPLPTYKALFKIIKALEVAKGSMLAQGFLRSMMNAENVERFPFSYFQFFFFVFFLSIHI